MAQQINPGLTQKVAASAIAAPFAAYLSTIVVYLINGIAFHCWVDPSAAASASSAATAAWTCPMHLPDFVATAVQGIVMVLGTGSIGWLVPPASRDQIEPPQS